MRTRLLNAERQSGMCSSTSEQTTRSNCRPCGQVSRDRSIVKKLQSGANLWLLSNHLVGDVTAVADDSVAANYFLQQVQLCTTCVQAVPKVQIGDDA